MFAERLFDHQTRAKPLGALGTVSRLNVGSNLAFSFFLKAFRAGGGLRAERAFLNVVDGPPQNFSSSGVVVGLGGRGALLAEVVSALLQSRFLSNRDDLLCGE